MKRVSLLLLTIVGLVSCDQDLRESKVVRINQGSVRGYKEADKNFYAFYGIPYATAPTGPHKFKGPLPPPSWKDTFDAIHKEIICPQGPGVFVYLRQGTNMDMKEDCLVINVFVPDTTEDNLSVVAYVHGGAFQLGFSNMVIHEEFINTGKIIEVSFNYRVGAHGFLCLGTEDVPGNAGMKDQVAALRWVKQNIAKFGGNPHDVTIAGYSAGSASVDLLMLSKSTRGLFNKVIPESGAATGVWAVQIDPLASAKEFARTLKFTNVDDVYALEEFYKTTPLDALQSDQTMERENSTFAFVPCVERITSEDSFLTEPPVDILTQGSYNKVPVLFGFANMEGLLRIASFEQWKSEMNVNFVKFLPADLEFANVKEREKVAKEAKELYFGDSDVDISTVQGFVDYFTDVMFAYSTIRSVYLQAQSDSESVYLYQFSYVDDFYKQLLPYDIYGANHGAQSLVIGSSDYIALVASSDKPSEEQLKMKRMLTDIWINFILSGKPMAGVSEEFPSGWPAVSLKDRYYMELNLKPELGKDLLKRRVDFWDGIYARYYRTPVAPPAPPPRKTEL